MRRVISYLILCACVALVTPTAAGAKPGFKSFDRTFPIASKLCARVERGQVPKRLRGSAPQVINACAVLQSAFSDAQTKVRATDSQLQAQLAADRAQLRNACHQAKLTHDRGSCKEARKTFRAERKALLVQERAANRNYFVVIENARKAFWSTVRSLRGGAGIKPDSPVKP